jgi:hypothetical protein
MGLPSARKPGFRTGTRIVLPSCPATNPNADAAAGPIAVATGGAAELTGQRPADVAAGVARQRASGDLAMAGRAI